MGTGRSESRVRMEAGARGGHETQSKTFLRKEGNGGEVCLPLVGNEADVTDQDSWPHVVDRGRPSHGRRRGAEETQEQLPVRWWGTGVPCGFKGAEANGFRSGLFRVGGFHDRHVRYVAVELIVIEAEAYYEAVVDFEAAVIDGDVDDAARGSIQKRADAFVRK